MSKEKIGKIQSRETGGSKEKVAANLPDQKKKQKKTCSGAGDQKTEEDDSAGGAAAEEKNYDAAFSGKEKLGVREINEEAQVNLS